MDILHEHDVDDPHLIPLQNRLLDAEIALRDMQAEFLHISDALIAAGNTHIAAKCAYYTALGRVPIRG